MKNEDKITASEAETFSSVPFFQINISITIYIETNVLMAI